MNHAEIQSLTKGLAPVFRDFVAESTAPLVATISDLERQIADLREIDVADTVRAVVADAVSTIPVPVDGKDADPELIRQMVADAVSGLPPAKDGASVTIDDVAPLIDQAVVAAVAALPAPLDGRHGQDADPEVIREMVTEAVAGIPAPKDGEPGKSVTVEDVAPFIASEVDRAVLALPVPKDGKDADPVDVDALVDATLAAMPPPPVEFAPEEVAENIAIAVRMLAEMPDSPAIERETAPSPIVNIALSDNWPPPTVNVSLPKAGAERVTVTEHTADGRIKSYVKTPMEEA